MLNITLFQITVNTLLITGTFLAIATPVEAQQARLGGTTVIDDGNTISTLAGEVELAPGQLLDDNGTDPVLTVETTILSLPNTSILRELSLDFEIDNNSINLLENRIASAVEDANLENASDVISLVDAFGTGIEAQQGQARVIGAGGFDTGTVVTALTVTAELAPSQQLTNDTVTIAAVEPGGGLSLDFGIDNNNPTRLEEAVANAIETVFLDSPNGLANNIGISDVISLVDAFIETNPEQGQARVSAALTLNDGNTLSAIVSEAKLAPGQLLQDDGADQNLAVVVQSENQNLVATGLSLDFGIDNSGGSAIESAIADTVDAAEFDSNSESDVISLVQALTNGNNDESLIDQLSEPSVALD